MRPLSIFIGPTLTPAERPQGRNLRYLPPATAGDMLALAAQPPHAVLLIDGLFETARPPWHKEILVLLAGGFDVWGAASLGALRAAELAPLGMRPSGMIAHAYAAGRIAGDDEVAVAHAPAGLDYRALSVAQVDVRATLCAAVRQRIVSADEAQRLRSAAHAIFFKDRTWAAVVAAAQAILPSSRTRALAAWLPRGAVSQKAIDARAAILAATDAELEAARPAPPETVFLRRLRGERS